MLSVLTKDGYMPIESRQSYYIEMNYDGFHELSFDVSNNDPINKYLVNEAVIKNEDNRFLIKDVNRRTKNTSYTCVIDLDEWKESIFFDTANDTRFQTKTLAQVLDIIKPNDWKITNASIRSIKRTPELKDATPYGILLSLEELYSVVFDIMVLTKEIHVIDPESFEYDGLYATSELNMNMATWQGSSKDFCTKLFAYGKVDENGNTVNISSVNGGKEYIENHTYTDKTITLVWRDERYTDPQSLYDDAKKKIEQLCVPKMSYDISIYDLSQINKEYDFLQFGLYKQVKTFINDELSILQKVVTYKKYYDKPDKNVITLSNEQQKFTSKVSNALGGSSNQIINGSILEQAQKESAQIINEFATKGHKYETENETYFLDKLPKEAAKFVMRQNLGGIAFSQNGWNGPYTTAWTIDGKFNASFITTGILKAIRIEAADIFGGTINGATITTDKDLKVGDNIYIGPNSFGQKSIFLSPDKKCKIERTSYQDANTLNIMNDFMTTIWSQTDDTNATMQVSPSGISLDYYARIDGEYQYTSAISLDDISAHIRGNEVYIMCETEQIVFEPSGGSYSGFFRPAYTTGECTLGTMENRFYRVYARYSEDATSDKRQKKDFLLFDERYIKLVDQLIPTLYRFIEQSEDKNLQAGFIAQEVLEAMEECGIDRKEFGAVKHSEWIDKETGQEKDEYSLVYSMFIPLLTYYIQFKNKDYENRLSKIESLLEKGDIK